MLALAVRLRIVSNMIVIWIGDSRLLADVKLFRQQFDETKLDNDVSVCTFLRVLLV